MITRQLWYQIISLVKESELHNCHSEMSLVVPVIIKKLEYFIAKFVYEYLQYPNKVFGVDVTDNGL